ncbi:MAG: 30S ribosomal protein S21 [Candidatus Dadabacteria bacterium]|jgi:small subunit ribosomal protein S21|nr:30S ribosomal protein S21 [Candidatus Dadabacteria bacterium]
MAEVVIGKNESIDNALRRFKRIVEREGIIAELRKRDHYEKPSEKKKKRARAARLRLLKRLSNRRE